MTRRSASWICSWEGTVSLKQVRKRRRRPEGRRPTQGGFGYLLKDRVLKVADFLDAAQRVASGGSALDPQVVASLVGGEHDALAALSEREREVLSLMAEGLTNSGIAERLVLTERTVEGHVRSVLTKLDLPAGQDAHRRVLAVILYLRAGGGRKTDGAPKDAAG
jgi:DNA-binding NarL/FixJ family response regulator